MRRLVPWTSRARTPRVSEHGRQPSFNGTLNHCSRQGGKRARGEITKRRLVDVIKAAGFAPTGEGLLADRELLANGTGILRWQYDWMHTAFQAGFMSDAMWLVFKHISTIKHGEAAGGASMVRHLRQCQFPFCMRSVGGSLKHLFEPEMLKKHRTHTYLVGNASVQFTLYALVRDWATIEAEDDPSATEHLLVYLAASRIIDIIRRVKHRQLSTASAKPMLLRACGQWLDLHKTLYGTRHIKPKYAWMWLFSSRIADCEWLFDMFYIERQHQRIRPQAEPVKNTVTFESSVLFRVVDAQMCSLRGEHPLYENYKLVGRQLPVAGDIVGWIADGCVSGGMKIHCDDIVLRGGLGGAAAVVLACLLSADGILIIKVELMQRVRANVWAQTAQQECWPAREAIHPIAWRELEDRSIFIIA